MQAKPSLPNPPESSNNHPTPKLIVTHVAPDFDAVAYAWLMAKYAPGFGAYQIAYTPFSNPNRDLLARADSVGDIGGKYDPKRWRFDHHHLPGAESTATCAAKMVWEHLLSLGIEVAHLKPLIEIIYQGDLGHVDPVGIHALLWGFGIRAKRNLGQRLSDPEMMAWGFDLLDISATWLKRQIEIKAELTEKVIWKSDDNLVCAIKNGSMGTSFAAYAEGAQLVVFEGKPIKLVPFPTDHPNAIKIPKWQQATEVTYPVGISRANEWQTPDVGFLVNEILNDPNLKSIIRTELTKWYQHPAGFFAGRGTAKGPDPKPLTCSIIEIALALNAAWKRPITSAPPSEHKEELDFCTCSKIFWTQGPHHQEDCPMFEVTE